ncbi:ATP-binding protein, partial [Vitellibacter sp. q18]|nr:ATP-binding protein [Aequorivita lutea]
DTGHVFILPEDSAREAALTGNGNILAARSLLDVCAYLRNQGTLQAAVAVDTEKSAIFPDLAEGRGQHQAKRALEIAAAGQHSLLMIGPPGSGKSMLAARLPGLMPDLEP